MRPTSRSPLSFIASAVLLHLAANPLAAQSRVATPVVQSDLAGSSIEARALTLRDASRDDRWLGLGVSDVRWAPDGSGVYFRWNQRPQVGDLPQNDPWFLTDASGEWVTELSRGEWSEVPSAEQHWNPSATAATWVSGDGLWLYDAERGTRRVVAMGRTMGRPRFTADGDAVHFESGSALYRYDIGDGALTVLASRMVRDLDVGTDAAAWLADQQRELFDVVRDRQETRRGVESALRSTGPARPQAIPVPESAQVDDIRLSPNGAWITFRATWPGADRPPTQYVDFVSESGYSEVNNARSKAGEPRDLVRLGVVAVDPLVPMDSVEVRWIDLDEAADGKTFPHGPYWNLDGSRAVAQFIGEDHEDMWIAEIDFESASARVLAHDHDDAWIGGPLIQANYLQPALMEWLPSGDLVFASERSGWSHLHLLTPDGRVRALTEGAWEVRGAQLSPDRSSWLLQTSREHPSEDHLYLMPSAGGEMERLTSEPGRHEGWWSPDGQRLAVISSESVQLPDLYVRDAEPGADAQRVSVSGADAYYQHPLTRPEIVEFEHPDGGPLWASLFRPEKPNAERAAIVHIHGGGYRQFAHRGYSVYGYATHLGFINYMLEQGYTVLDFDYRGSAGYGSDYRTDIADAMGISDTDGAVAGARWLAANEGVDPDRIGIYGVSYGGFLTLTSLFRYPGVFNAGVARAAVTDWAHYSDGWTSRILGVPAENPEAYRLSSPIYYAEGLEDPLLITHGLMDNNVHFQDAARLVQRLIELEKDFEVMYFPVEPHTVETEASRYDLVRRQAAFFDEHLRGIRR